MLVHSADGVINLVHVSAGENSGYNTVQPQALVQGDKSVDAPDEPVPVRTNSRRGSTSSRRSSGSRMSFDRDAQGALRFTTGVQQPTATLHDALQTASRVVICSTCGEMVPVDYKARRAHAIAKHTDRGEDSFVAEWDEEEDFGEVLAAAMKKAFPNESPNSDYECSKCGKEVKTMDTRRSHVSGLHMQGDGNLSCPFQDCKEGRPTVTKMNKHIQDDHKIRPPDLKDPEKSRYTINKSQLKSRLNVAIQQCFPCPLPRKRSVSPLYDRSQCAMVDQITANWLRENVVATRTESVDMKTLWEQYDDDLLHYRCRPLPADKFLETLKFVLPFGVY